MTRQVQFDYEICSAAGTPYPCTITYNITGKLVHDHTVTFNFGYDDPEHGEKYLPEIVGQIICDVEGTNQLVFEEDLKIEL